MVEEKWHMVHEPGYEHVYWVSNLGRVQGVRSGRVLKQGVHPKGYRSLVLSAGGRRKTVLVHRLVLSAFVGPCPEGLEARHLDGDRSNNALTNLKWGTPEENAHDKRRHGTHADGDRNPAAKIREWEADEIRALARTGRHSQRAIAAAYGISQGQVSRIVTGKRRGPHSGE